MLFWERFYEMNLSKDKIILFKKKLQNLAQAFPYIEIRDLDRLNDLISNEEIDSYVQDCFFSELEIVSKSYIERLINLCLEYAFSNLINSLIKFCFTNEIIDNNVENDWELITKLITAITNFEFSHYVDIEQQSGRIQFGVEHRVIALKVKQIPFFERLAILKLLRDLYVEKLLNKSLAENNINTQSFYIQKYNKITDTIRSELTIEERQEKRWSRLYALESLGYGPNASNDLFPNQTLDPLKFDELLWNNFNIMLFPSFGNISFAPSQIIVTNEGDGCIPNPKLEIWAKGELIIEISVITVIPAHQNVIFRLGTDDLEALKKLNPNENLQIYLIFKKFDNTPFKFMRSILVGKISEGVNLDETHIKLLASQIGISETKLKELANSQINSNENLFENIKSFIKEINYLVQEKNGYQLLINSNQNQVYNLRSETNIQVALQHWLEPMCRTLNIDINREPLTGRGYLDFKFSIGSNWKCLVEIKLFHSKKLEHGLKIQLPTYLKADQASFGIYVPVIFDSSSYEKELDNLQKKAKELTDKNDFTIEVIPIKAWKRKSASKANKL